MHTELQEVWKLYQDVANTPGTVPWTQEHFKCLSWLHAWMSYIQVKLKARSDPSSPFVLLSMRKGCGQRGWEGAPSSEHLHFAFSCCSFSSLWRKMQSLLPEQKQWQRAWGQSVVWHLVGVWAHETFLWAVENRLVSGVIQLMEHQHWCTRSVTRNPPTPRHLMTDSNICGRQPHAVPYFVLLRYIELQTIPVQFLANMASP